MPLSCSSRVMCSILHHLSFTFLQAWVTAVEDICSTWPVEDLATVPPASRCAVLHALAITLPNTKVPSTLLQNLLQPLADVDDARGLRECK